MSTSPLFFDDTVIVLAQALTGLGHLRVSRVWNHESQRVFAAMVISSGYQESPDLAPDGEAQFWKMMEGFFEASR